VFKREEFIKSIFSISSPKEFNEKALELFRFQVENVEPYSRFVAHLGVNYSQIEEHTEIPFLPISFFKSEKIISSNLGVNGVFRSSGTTGSVKSEHLVHDFDLYKSSFMNYFNSIYGNPKEAVVLALLPSYLGRKDSSLVYMVNELIQSSESLDSGFYLENTSELASKIEQLKNEKKPVYLFGVTFALLALAEQYKGASWGHLTVIETGGMKGKGEELTRGELHSLLSSKLGLSTVYSEYGMTELFSQAYAEGEWFTSPKWMKILVRETEDPFSYVPLNRTGGINIIDLANVDSCAFIATQDLGKLNAENKFQVLGRFDNSDVRGCNLMIQSL